MNTIKFKLPLFWKFSIAIIFIVIVFGSINSILIYNNVQSALQTETEKRALFIANSISHQIVSSLLFEDYVTLQNVINGIKEIDQNIEYIFIVDSKGNVVVHTFPLNFPAQLLGANRIDENQKFKTQLIILKNKNEELILDIAVPILDGKIGNVRVGLKESSIQSDVQKTINVFWIMVAVFLTFGIIGALVFANFITKPIKTIQNVADNIELSQIGKEQLPQIRIREKFLDRIKMLFRAEDEIDILADRFNQMIFRLDKAYRDLQNAQSNLIQSEKLATVGILTAGLAHEINNPVAGLQNCIRRIKNDPANIEQNKKYLVMMENAVDKIEKVVGNLLNFTRKQSGDFISLSISEIVENSLILVSHRLEKLRISVTNNIPTNLPMIKGNKNQLEQVLLNLFINSIDSIEEKISKHPDSERRLIVSANRESDFVKIKIEDTGIGISENILDKIFDPFFTTKSPGKGTGLGLFVVYNIIEAHQGKIYIESKEGKGTRVTLHFPIINN
ncbi:ATP-binding protein [Ignavibacteria bacterium 4148-Me]|uniref:ATP-binding protein n=1 Tax=Rosettibacter primus TaxID=3111523 RepID=UPI00247CAC10|nr:ATP-binding protein [Ignavibacteria bacterium]